MTTDAAKLGDEIDDLVLQTIKFRVERALLKAGHILLDHHHVRGASVLLENTQSIVNECVAEHVAALAIVRAKGKS
jgi:hypothetical protein